MTHDQTTKNRAILSSKFKLLGLAAAAAGIVLTGPASATLGQLLGDWKNVNPNTRDIVRIMITDAGGAVEVHAWGACSPTPCDWGTVKAIPYAPNVSAPLPADAQYLEADFPQSFAQVKLIIDPAPAGGELRAVALTRFTDNSGRSNEVNTDLFKK
jgi:hypothetical protein